MQTQTLTSLFLPQLCFVSLYAQKKDNLWSQIGQTQVHLSIDLINQVV